MLLRQARQAPRGTFSGSRQGRKRLNCQGYNLFGPVQDG